MNREITVEYNREFLRSVFWIMWFDSIGTKALIAWGIAGLVFTPFILWQGFWFYVLVMIFLGMVLGWLLFQKSAFQMDDSTQSSLQLSPYTVIVGFTDLHLELVDAIFPWQRIQAVKRYPIAWLISFADSANYIILPTAKLDRNLKGFIMRKLKDSRG
jgi:hypothetical protein